MASSVTEYRMDEGMAVFEVAWEVLNKVGGIHTVIRTKSRSSIQDIGPNKYFMFGPLLQSNRHQVQTELDEVSIVDEETPSLQLQAVKLTIESMRAKSMGIRYGRWLIDGQPQSILFDIEQAKRLYKNEWLKEWWVKTRISVPESDENAVNCVIFGFLVSWFLGEWIYQFKILADGKKPMAVAHFHEWQAGAGLVLARVNKHPIGTVFTTHATLLGRHLCAGDVDFYNKLAEFNCDEAAGSRGIYHQYCMERAAAASAHVFTTVSSVTGEECEKLLHRKPDYITPNGINVKKFAAPHEFQSLHAKSKKKIVNFVKGHFNQHLDFDLEETLFMFSAGRYEYRNKGVDMFIESLARLNHRLKSSNSKKTVIAFLIFPAKTNGFNVDTMQGQATVKSIRDTVTNIQEEIGKRLFESCLQGKYPNGENGFEWLSSEDVVKMKRIIYARDAALGNSTNFPPICTHNMENQNDPILTQLRKSGLYNAPSDRVKIIFHPEFLKETSPLLPMNYEEFVRGCHMGVFPSYYEPWGYTPAECTVMGIPNVSTNLSGFGCFMEQRGCGGNTMHTKTGKNAVDYGVYVVDRKFKNPDESSDQLTDILFNFANLSRRQRIIMRNRTERLSEHLDWNTLGGYYQQARVGALSKVIDFDDMRGIDENVDEGFDLDFRNINLPKEEISRPQSVFNERASLGDSGSGKSPATPVHQARAILETLTSNPIQTRELEMAINQKLGLDDGNQQLDEEDIDNILQKITQADPNFSLEN